MSSDVESAVAGLKDRIQLASEKL